MKHILIFSLAYYPHVGGAEVAIKETTDRIAPSDIEFHMLTLRFSTADAKEEKIENVSVHRIGKGSSYISKILFIPRAVWTARKLNKQHHFDGAWAMMSYMLFPVVLMRMCGLRIPYILTLQEGDPFELVFSRWYIKIFSPLLRYGFRHASVVQVISTFLGTWARKEGFTGLLEIIPNGVDVQKFSGAKTPHQGVELIHTGRLVHKNALDTIILALPLVPEVRLRLVGDGPDKSSLEQLAQELGVRRRVEFISYVDHAELQVFLRSADIFVRPSRSEGMGNSFVEAMATGLPVIATQEGGIADFLFDAKRNPDKPTTGWAVDKDSPKQIAEAVKDILANPEQAKKVVANARAMVSEKYDWDLIARNMREKIFAKVI